MKPKLPKGSFKKLPANILSNHLAGLPSNLNVFVKPASILLNSDFDLLEELIPRMLFERDCMRQIRAGKQLKELIKLCYQANTPCLLIGKYGVGKSELLEQAAEEIGIGYICRDLSLMEPPDLVGMPKLGEKTTSYLPPSFLPTKGKGLLVFEELNRCPNYMRAPCLQLLTARMLNDYSLPNGWLPVAAINPSDSGYDVQELDAAILSRFVKVQVVPDKKEWLAWAESKNLNESVRGYVDSDPKIFVDTSPRDWYMVAKLLQTTDELKVDKTIMSAAIAGVVGRERAVAFNLYCKGGIPLPKIGDVLMDYNKYKKQVYDWTNEGKTDCLESLCHSLKVMLQVEDHYTKMKNNKVMWKNLASFLNDMLPDLREDIKSFMVEHKYELPFVM